MLAGMVRQQYDTSAVVSARAHCFYTVPYSYQFFLQVEALRTVSTRQNKECLTERIDNGTPTVLSARAHLFDVMFVDYSLTDCRLFLRIRTGNPWQNLAKP